MSEVLRNTDGQTGLPRYFVPIFNVLKTIQKGRLSVGLPDGRVFVAESPNPAAGPDARFDVVDTSMFARIIRDGEIGFSEAYMDGMWNSPDLMALLDLLLLNNDEVGHALPGLKIVRAYERTRHWFRQNSKRQAAKNISAHYDLGNQFYGTWLDETMTYSSALFDQAEQDLASAQARKYSSICDMIGVRDGAHVLEIGCGWGGFAEHAAMERGAKVTGLTISREQHDFAKRRVFEAGLSERVDIVLRDYRDETGRYDGIASIEMFEAVGEKYWPVYFGAVRERLNPGAVAGLQIITIRDNLFAHYRKSVDFIQKYIFPGGMLPSVEILGSEISRAGLAITDKVSFGPSYSETLRRWHTDFNAAWPDIEVLGFDDRFRRMWNFYLTSCAATFRAGTTDVIQIGLRKDG